MAPEDECMREMFVETPWEHSGRWRCRCRSCRSSTATTRPARRSRTGTTGSRRDTSSDARSPWSLTVSDHQRTDHTRKGINMESSGASVPKQVIVMRRDLGMRRGKEIAQGSHASMIWLALRIRQPGYTFTEAERRWLDGTFTKVCVRVDSEEELLAVVQRAQEAGVLVYLCVDAGMTEFHGVPTPTCCAVGPDFPERIDPITGQLKVL